MTNPQALSRLSLASLQSLQSQYEACLAAIAISHQSYSIAGRTFNRADAEKVAEILGAILMAIDIKNGTTVRVVYSDMSV